MIDLTALFTVVRCQCFIGRVGPVNITVNSQYSFFKVATPDILVAA